MKRLIFLGLLLIAVLLGSKVSGQRVELVSGDLGFLNGEKDLKVEFVYDGMGVGKFKSEDEYIQTKVTEYNKKEAGKGDNWAKSWKSDRTAKFEPKFEELINRVLKDKGVSVLSSNIKAKYTIIVKTLMTEPGWNIGISRKPAYIDYEINFIETGKSANVLAKITMIKVPGQGGMGYDFDTGFRLQEAYAKCGKELGKFLLKKAYK